MIASTRCGLLILLGTSLLAGCQGSHVARQSSTGARDVAGRTSADESSKVREVKALAARNRESRIRLVADADDVEKSEELTPAAGPETTSLTLDGAIETALVQNPDLIAVRQAEGVSAAAYGVAETYPFNPFVQFRATPYQHGAQGQTGSMFHYVLLQQNIQLGQQQQFREEVAASQLNQVRWNIHNFELLNAAQTTRFYLTALYQKSIRDLTQKSADLNEQLLQISQRREEAGDITKADLAIVRIDARSTSQQADLAEANYQTALLDLRRQLNIPLEQELELADHLADLRWKPARDAAQSQMAMCNSTVDIDLETKGDKDLIKRLADGRPDLMAARADVETACAAYRLANANRTPDLMFGPFYSRDDFGTWFFGFQGQMDLMVNNNGQPLVRQRSAEHGQRAVTWQQLQVRAELEAIAAVDRYERARRLVAASRREMLSDLPSELQRLEEQFKENEVDVLRIFQARTSLIQNRRAALDLLNELAQATAAVTATTGIFPSAMLTTGQ